MFPLENVRVLDVECFPWKMRALGTAECFPRRRDVQF